MRRTEAQRLKELERENTELKNLLSDQKLKNKALEIPFEKIRPGPERQRVVAAKAQAALPCSERDLCRWLRLSRGILSYQLKPLPEAKQSWRWKLCRCPLATRR